MRSTTRPSSLSRFSPLFIGARTATFRSSGPEASVTARFSPLFIGARTATLERVLVAARAVPVSVPSLSGHELRLTFALLHLQLISSFQSPLHRGTNCDRWLGRLSVCTLGPSGGPANRATAWSAVKLSGLAMSGITRCLRSSSETRRLCSGCAQESALAWPPRRPTGGSPLPPSRRTHDPRGGSPPRPCL